MLLNNKIPFNLLHRLIKEITTIAEEKNIALNDAISELADMISIKSGDNIKYMHLRGWLYEDKSIPTKKLISIANALNYKL